MTRSLATARALTLLQAFTKVASSSCSCQCSGKPRRWSPQTASRSLAADCCAAAAAAVAAAVAMPAQRSRVPTSKSVRLYQLLLNLLQLAQASKEHRCRNSTEAADAQKVLHHNARSFV